MNKLFLIFVVCILPFTLSAQTQQGYVKTIGRPNKPGVALGGVSVRVKGEHNAVVSKGDGTFSMPMAGKKNGDAYSLQQVQKAGYELNERGVIGRQYAFSTKVPLTIVMVSTAQLQADKQRIENNAYQVAERNYHAKLAQLEKDRDAGVLTAEAYRQELQQLQDKFEKYQSLIDELAEHYAHVDYDNLDAKEREINQCIENGQLERADSLLHTIFDPVDVLKRNQQALSRIDQTVVQATDIIRQANADMQRVLKQQEKDAEYLYQLYTIALARYDNDKAAQYITTRAELDTTNVEWSIQVGRFIHDYLADYPKALEYYQRVLRRSLIQYGEQNDWTAIAYNNIGGVYSNLDDNTKALEYYTKALIIREKVYGAEHPAVAAMYNNIGCVYDSQGDYSQSMDYYKKTLTIVEKIYGTVHPDVATLLNNIGAVYNHIGDYTRALEFYGKALNIRLKVYESGHPSVAMSYDNIGTVYNMLGDNTKALEYYTKALTIDEKVFGAEHPAVAFSYNNIGYVNNCQGDYTRALVYYTKALEIFTKVFGSENPSVATSYNNISAVYVHQGNYSKAIECCIKALDIRKKTLGANHPDVATSYNNIGAVYDSQGDNTKALEYYNKALIILEKMFGAEHPNIAASYENIGMIYASQGDYSMALEYLTKVLTIREKVFGADHPKTKTIRSYLMYVEYNIALPDNTTVKDFMSTHVFTATITDGDTPAKAQGLSGEYILLELNDWTQNSTTSLFEKITELQGKPKDILVMKNGVISRYHFENTIGARFFIKQVSKAECAAINKVYEQWKKKR